MLNTRLLSAGPIGLALAGLALVSSLPAQRDAEPPALLRPLSDVPAAARAWDANERILNPSIVRSQFVAVDVAALRRARVVSAAAFGASLVLDVGEPQAVLAYDQWSGSERVSGGSVVLAASADGIVAGTIRTAERVLAIAYADAPGVHVLHELDGAREALPFAVQSPDVDAIDAGGGASPAGAAGPNLDVVVFYTPLARQTAGGKTAVETLIVGGIAQANRTNTNSGLDVKFRLVHVAETNYVEDSSNDLSRFRSTADGFMDEVHAVRTQYGGDLMHLITQPPSPGYCGVAYLMTNLSTSFRQWSFGVTLRSCISGNVICHEIGHNIGCHHDRDNAGGALYPYAYGYRTPDSAYRTVMAYSPGTRVDLWSSPNVQHQGYTMGVANSEDNVRTIDNTKATVRAFYATTAYEWELIEGGVPSPVGEPRIRGEGTVNGAQPSRVILSGAWPTAPGALFLGTSALNVGVFGGTLVPSPDFAIPVVGDLADTAVSASWLRRLPAGVPIWLQALYLSPAPQGFSMTDGLKVVGL